MVNKTLADIQVYVPSIVGNALGALNDYVGLIVLLGIVSGIAITIGYMMGAFKNIGGRQ
jgi:hypothetical protein